MSKIGSKVQLSQTPNLREKDLSQQDLDEIQEFKKVKYDGTKKALNQIYQRESQRIDCKLIPGGGIKQASLNLNVQSQLVQQMSAQLKVMKVNGPLEEALKNQLIDAVESVATKNKKDASNAGLGDQEWHLFTKEQLYETLQVGDKGLSTNEHSRRLTEYGLNMLTPPPARHWFLKFLDTLKGGFQIMMIVGSLMCFIVIILEMDVQTLVLGIVLLLVVLLTSFFQMYQEGKSDKVIIQLIDKIIQQLKLKYYNFLFKNFNYPLHLVLNDRISINKQNNILSFITQINLIYQQI